MHIIYTSIQLHSHASTQARMYRSVPVSGDTISKEDVILSVDTKYDVSSHVHLRQETCTVIVVGLRTELCVTNWMSFIVTDVNWTLMLWLLQADFVIDANRTVVLWLMQREHYLVLLLVLAPHWDFDWYKQDTGMWYCYFKQNTAIVTADKMIILVIKSIINYSSKTA